MRLTWLHLLYTNSSTPPEGQESRAGHAMCLDWCMGMGRHGQGLRLDVGGHERHEAPKGGGGVRVIVHRTICTDFRAILDKRPPES